MLATNYTNLRNNLKQILDTVVNDFETFIITRKNNENVVVLSETKYNNLIENAYLRQSSTNHKRLLESIDQLDTGKSQVRNLEDYE